MANYEEILSEEEKEYFRKSQSCRSSEERKKLIMEDQRLQESNSDIEYPYVDMSLEEFCAKYNLIERDDFKW